MLALMLLLHHATAKDSPFEPHVIKKIASCPDVGYYFKQELVANALEPACFLCFCRDEGAVCWHRQPSRCDDQRYQHLGERKRVTRLRRGLADIFDRDSSKDISNLSPPEKCKPHESYSIGCPPDDWCEGCTVCNCDAHGRWICHPLSFCEKVNDKLPIRQSIKQRPTLTTKKPAFTTSRKATNKNNSPKITKKQPVKKKERLIVKPQNKTKKEPVKPNGISVKKAKSPVFKKKPIPKSTGRPNNKIFRKSSTNEIVKGKSKPINETEKIMRDMAHTIYKKVMASVEKILKESHKIKTYGKDTQKRPMLKNFKSDAKKNINTNKTMEIKNSNPKLIKNNQVSYSKNYKRSKREILPMNSSKYDFNQETTTTALNINTTNESFSYQTLDNEFTISTPILTVLSKPYYFKYTVDKENDINNLTTIQEELFLHPEITIIPNKIESKNNLEEDNYAGKLLKNISNDEANINFTIELLNISNSLNNDNHSIHHNNSIIARKIKAPCGKVCSFTKIFKKLFAFDNTNTTMPVINKVRKNNILKYLKRVIRKIFHKGKAMDVNLRKHLKQDSPKCNFTTTVCINFGFCNADLHSKQISAKIYKLRTESKKIMKSIMIIKGLLKLLDIGTKQDRENSTRSTKQILNDDIEKINAIIQENYDNYTMNTTQRIQVAYIKQNIEIFMQSLENFAQILNDIVKILTTRKIYSPKLLNSYFKNPVTQSPTKVNNKAIKNNITSGEKLNKLKKLLINYNIVQNNFINKMFNAITSLEPLINNTTATEKNIENSNEKSNNTDAVETYAKNIIENLKKLKNLVHKLNSKSRKKRQAMEDSNVVEYLLILMEYLLKQKKQIHISPANDGIDLLIEAIQSVPDIKATKKKVLDYIPVQIERETTQSAFTLHRTSKFADKSTNDTLKSVVAQFKTFESVDEDEENNDYYQYNKIFDKSNRLKEKIETEDIINPTTTLTSNIRVAKGENDNVVSKKLDMKKEDHDKVRYELFVDDSDDDDGVILTTMKPPDVVKEPVTSKKPARTKPPANFKDEQTTSREVNDTYGNQMRIKLDWVEESYNQEDERKELPRFTETTTQKITPTHTTSEAVTRTVKSKKAKLSKYDDPTSSISRETIDEDRKRNKHLNSEYVMYKKQMDLLNSLDYGTEKNDLDNLDSNQDKSNLDQFPLYFV